MDDVITKVDMFMRAEMPQIEMHGGDWEVTDFTDGKLSVHLDGACSGCGISPMTVQAIKRRLPNTIDAVESVDVDIGEEEDVTEGPFA